MELANRCRIVSRNTRLFGLAMILWVGVTAGRFVDAQQPAPRTAPAATVRVQPPFLATPARATSTQAAPAQATSAAAMASVGAGARRLQSRKA